VITRWPVFERHRVFEELRHTERPFMQWNAALRSLRRQRLPTRLSCTMGENKSRAHLFAHRIQGQFIAGTVFCDDRLYWILTGSVDPRE